MDIQPSDIWVPAGVLLGFQFASSTRRINREIAMRKEGELTWLPPSDILNLFSMVVSTVGVFVLPMLDFGNKGFMTYAFGLAVLLFAGVPFGLAGHYELYNKRLKRHQLYFPFQEKIVIAVVAALAFTYVVIAVMTYFPFQEKIVIAVVAALAIPCVVIWVMRYGLRKVTICIDEVIDKQMQDAAKEDHKYFGEYAEEAFRLFLDKRRKEKKSGDTKS